MNFENLFIGLIIEALKEHGDEPGAITLECVTEFLSFRTALHKVYSVYLKPAKDEDANEEREKTLLSQRRKLLETVKRFRDDLDSFVYENPIPDDILYQIEKE